MEKEYLNKEELLDLQRRQEQKKIKLKYCNRFRNEGKERILAKWFHLARTFFLTNIATMIVLYIAITINKSIHWFNDKEIDLKTTYKFITTIIDDISKNGTIAYNLGLEKTIIELEKIIKNNFTLTEVILISGIAILFPILVVMIQKKYIETEVFKKVIDYKISSLSNWELKKIKKTKDTIKLNFNLKTDGSYKKDELKSSISDLCKEFKMDDGVVDTSKSTSKAEIRLYKETISKMPNFDDIPDIELKKKIILNNTGIKDFKITSIDKEKIVFKKRPNINSGGVNIQELKNSIETISIILGKGNAEIIEDGYDIFTMKFKGILPDKETNTQTTTLDLLKKDQLYLGTTSNEKIYTPESEERGKLNGHILCIGASGSGKSFAIEKIVTNWLNPEAIKDVSHLFVLDFKNSGDYKKYESIDKVTYSGGDIHSALKICMEVEYEYQKRNIYYNLYGKISLPKILFVVDEIQTINEKLDDKNISRIERNSWAQIETIMNILSSKGRSTMSLIAILQKGTAESLPGGATFRDNLRHRFALKNMNMDLLMDAELIQKKNIKADQLKQGQFIYMDSLLPEDSIQSGFVNQWDYDWTKHIKEINEIKMSDEDIEMQKKMDDLDDIVEIAKQLEKDFYEELELSGKKTLIENITEMKEFKERDFINEAISIYKKDESDYVEWNVFEDEMWEAFDDEDSEKLAKTIKDGICLKDKETIKITPSKSRVFDNKEKTKRESRLKKKSINENITEMKYEIATIEEKLIETEIIDEDDELYIEIFEERKLLEHK
jgi:hypothetical protein